MSDGAAGMTGTIPVSVIVLTYQEEANIGACLESVASWADQIVVVDSGSSDRTVEIARGFTEEIVEHEYVDHASQWAWALRNTALRHPWLLALDADNIVTPELRSQIGDVARSDDREYGGYYVRHTHLFRNRRVRGLKAKWLRLVRHADARVDESELVDVRFVVEGKVGSLSGAIVESNQKELAIDFWIDKHQKFAVRMAAEEVLRRAGGLDREVAPRLFGRGPEQRMLWLKERWNNLPLYVRPFLYFGYRYVFRLGFVDGRNGLVYHTLQALWFRLLVDLKIAELNDRVEKGGLTLESLNAIVRPQASRAGTDPTTRPSSIGASAE